MNPLLQKSDFDKRVYPTLQWLRDSIEVHDGRGSAAFYSRLRYPLRGWAPPYPETTGYLIETLFDYAADRSDKRLEDLAWTCADWLCDIQLPDGAFPSLYTGSGLSSVFNSGQILFGLLRAHRETQADQYFDAAQKALEWLCTQVREDGCWIVGSYVPGYSPAYYSRVIWAVAAANEQYAVPVAEATAWKALRFYQNKILSNGAVRDWSFRPQEPAFTHTIAYTLRGFLESAVLLKEAQLFEKIRLSADTLVELKRSKGKIGGSYDENWRGDYSFSCVTGHAQLSIFLLRMFEITGRQVYLDTAAAILEEVSGAPNRLPVKGYFGAIPGSLPVWGRYFPFRYPNWAAKFYLDACLLLHRLQRPAR